MGFALLALGAICGLVSLVCFIIVLVKMFQHDMILMGILSIFICGIIPLVVGWQNADAWNIRKLMLVWTLALVASIAFYVLGGAMSASALQNMAPPQ